MMVSPLHTGNPGRFCRPAINTIPIEWIYCKTVQPVAPSSGIFADQNQGMKLLLTILMLITSTVLLSQDRDRLEKAETLHRQGTELLTANLPKPFDRVRALSKFIQSQELLLSGVDDRVELSRQNEQQLHDLAAYFATLNNPDSLLELTPFYPDSVFQRNSAYSPRSKQLVGEYLDLQRRIAKNNFLQLGSLYRPDTSTSISGSRPVIDFTNYWPLEVMEFAAWLRRTEDEVRTFPGKARQEMLHFHLQHLLDSSQVQAETDRHGYTQQVLRERIQAEENAQELMQTRMQRMKWAGTGGLALFLFIAYLVWKKSNQLLKRNHQLLLDEKKRSEDLLLNMLPAEIVRQLKKEGAVTARRYEGVSVMFSDFKSFTQIAKKLEPEELIGELNYCFSAFDQIIEKYHLQKIKTIGDSYMCVGGLYTRGDKHVSRMVAAALEMQQFLLSRKQNGAFQGISFSEARIGIHTGPVVAGVIGSRTIAFDVWGDTVNVAQQMEQRSEVGQVNISGETFALVQDAFDCEFRGRVEVKNKRKYDMYFVTKAKSA